MRNIFNLDLDQRKDGNENRLDGDCFVVGRTNDTLADQLHSCAREKASLDARAQLPAFYKASESGLTIAVAAVVLLALNSRPLLTGLITDQPLILLAGIAALAALIFLRRHEPAYLKKRKATAEYALAEKQNSALVHQAYSHFGVPDDAVSIDVLGRPYHLRKGREVKDNTMNSANLDYINYEYKAYVKKNRLYLANAEANFAIPLKNITGILPVKRRMALSGWNKDISPQSPEYKKYHIAGSEGKISARCMSVRIENYNGDWEILVPNYDAQVIADLTGLELPA